MVAHHRRHLVHDEHQRHLIVRNDPPTARSVSTAVCRLPFAPFGRSVLINGGSDLFFFV
jgi:hypothetical protein